MRERIAKFQNPWKHLIHLNKFFSLVVTVTEDWAAASMVKEALSKVLYRRAWGRTHFIQESGQCMIKPWPEELVRDANPPSYCDTHAYLSGKDLGEANGCRKTVLTLIHNPMVTREHPSVFPDRYCRVICGVVAGISEHDLPIRIHREEYLHSFEPDERDDVVGKILSPLASVRGVRILTEGDEVKYSEPLAPPIMPSQQAIEE